jgi:repressor LexA
MQFPGTGAALLTPKQKAILDFIAAFSASHGFAPSQQEIARHFQFKSLGTVQNYLVRLERQGVLHKTWNARRGMQALESRTPSPQPHKRSAHAPLVHVASETVPLPLVGRVAAGRPIEAVAADETIDVPAYMVRTRNSFVLKVVGDSMIDDGILDGDWVIIRKQEQAENGQTVVALINNEATIKKFYKKGAVVELHPANPKYKPIVVSEGDFRIEGILAGVLRVVK